MITIFAFDRKYTTVSGWNWYTWRNKKIGTLYKNSSAFCSQTNINKLQRWLLTVAGCFSWNSVYVIKYNKRSNRNRQS